MNKLILGLEAGGTKCVLGMIRASGEDRPEILDRVRIPTEHPDVTFANLEQQAKALIKMHGQPDAVAIGSFGPVSINPAADNYGQIEKTPKPNWEGADILGFMSKFAPESVIDTDVAAAALSEARWGAATGSEVVAYITVGTGIGVGMARNGRTLHGSRHYEMGHIAAVVDPVKDPFAGQCPFHGQCLEGMAAGPSIIARWGKDLSALGADHPGNDLIADYLGQLVAAISLMHAPHQIVLGGGVPKTPGLMERVRTAAAKRLAGYPSSAPDAGDHAAWENYLLAPALGDDAGLLGTAALCLSAE